METAAEEISRLAAQFFQGDHPQGGSSQGQVYQNYLDPPLDVVASRFNTTRAKLNIVLDVAGDLSGKEIWDIGCANGALAIEMSRRGGKVTGVDSDSRQLAIANLAARACDVDARWIRADICSTFELRVDLITCMSVWKWVCRDRGRLVADESVRKLARGADLLLIELGITDSGFDLGIPMKRADVGDYLISLLPRSHVRLAGTVTDDRYHNERDIWEIR